MSTKAHCESSKLLERKKEKRKARADAPAQNSKRERSPDSESPRKKAKTIPETGILLEPSPQKVNQSYLQVFGENVCTIVLSFLTISG